MPRKKNYCLEESHIEIQPVQATGLDPRKDSELRSACIDMVELLGSETRLPNAMRVLDLSSWLGRGIDEWVFDSINCIRECLLSGSKETSTGCAYRYKIGYFFTYLLELPAAVTPPSPRDLCPVHIEGFMHWLSRRGKELAWTGGSTRSNFQGVKSLLLEMFTRGFIVGEPSRYFPRVPFTWRHDGESRQTSLSDREQASLANALKSDLSDIHHGRLQIAQSQIQALRLLLVAHRQGINLTPLLELRRDTLSPGLLPGTVLMRTRKYRNRKRTTNVARSADDPRKDPSSATSIAFSLAEGVVVQQAIASTNDLVAEAPAALKNRVWLYRSQARRNMGKVTCLSSRSLPDAFASIVRRHNLMGDDGQPLHINLSRLRKAFFDRAFRISEGSLPITSNLMGNTPDVAGLNYPSMTTQRKADAAQFLNNDYLSSMRTESPASRGESRAAHTLVDVHPLHLIKGRTRPTSTPVAACGNTIGGEHSPHDGFTHCTRFVMCLFCSSFAVVGTLDELWRLFSFRAFAVQELRHLDGALGLFRTADDALEDLRDRYRLIIPYIGTFTQRQFPASVVREASLKAENTPHPFWQHQMTMSRKVQAT
jgi:hypothetical protein